MCFMEAGPDLKLLLIPGERACLRLWHLLLEDGVRCCFQQ